MNQGVVLLLHKAFVDSSVGSCKNEVIVMILALENYRVADFLIDGIGPKVRIGKGMLAWVSYGDSVTQTWILLGRERRLYQPIESWISVHVKEDSFAKGRGLILAHRKFIARIMGFGTNEGILVAPKAADGRPDSMDRKEQ